MADEGLTLGGLDLQAGVYRLTHLSMPPPKKRPEWAENVDGDGAGLVRDPLFENRTIEATVEVRAAKNAAQDAAQTLVGEIEEADRVKGGIPVVWTPAGSTDSLTFYLLTGEVAGFPMTVESGYYSGVLTLELVLTCRPYGYGLEVSGPSTSAGAPVVILSVPSVAGDVAAEARLRVTDTATQSRNFVAWGLENRHQAGHDLLLTTPDLFGFPYFAGTLQTRSGSVSTQVLRGTLTTAPLTICGSGSQPHLGTYRVFARYWASGLGVRLRLVWREGDGPYTANPWLSPPAEDAWCESDLGVVSVEGTPPGLGFQRWLGDVEAYSDVGGDTLDIDYLVLMPAGEGFGKARRPPRFETPTTFSARDEFDQTAGNLTGKTAPAGGVWAGAGDATDFAVETTGKTAQRSEVSDANVNTGRYAVSGVAGFAAQVAQVDFKQNWSGIVAGGQEYGVIARYTDTNNWLHAVTRANSGGKFEVKKRVAGTVTKLFSSDAIPYQPGNAWYTFRLAVDAAGQWFVWYYPQGGNPGEPVAQGVDSALATGGALASGKPGFYDVNTSAGAYVRNFDNFSAFAPAADAAVFASQAIEFRHDQTLRANADALHWGPPNQYRGAPFSLPPAGVENRTSRVAVMARRNDIETLPVGVDVSDGLQAQVFYTPRWLVVP